MIIVPLDTSNKLDFVFQTHLVEIERLYQKLPKNERIRVEQWVKKLCEVTTLDAWKRNRNNYARVLLDQISRKQLEDPFHTLPSDGPLKTLPLYKLKPFDLSPRKGRPGPSDEDANKDHGSMTWLGKSVGSPGPRGRSSSPARNRYTSPGRGSPKRGVSPARGVSPGRRNRAQTPTRVTAPTTPSSWRQTNVSSDTAAPGGPLHARVAGDLVEEKRRLESKFHEIDRKYAEAMESVVAELHKERAERVGMQGQLEVFKTKYASIEDQLRESYHIIEVQKKQIRTLQAHLLNPSDPLVENAPISTGERTHNVNEAVGDANPGRITGGASVMTTALKADESGKPSFHTYVTSQSVVDEAGQAPIVTSQQGLKADDLLGSDTAFLNYLDKFQKDTDELTSRHKQSLL